MEKKLTNLYNQCTFKHSNFSHFSRCEKITLFYIFADDRYNQLLKGYDISMGKFEMKFPKDIDELANFMVENGLLYSDFSFLSEWYYQLVEESIAKKTAIDSIQHSNEQLEKRIQQTECKIFEAKWFVQNFKSI